MAPLQLILPVYLLSNGSDLAVLNILYQAFYDSEQEKIQPQATATELIFGDKLLLQPVPPRHLLIARKQLK